MFSIRLNLVILVMKQISNKSILATLLTIALKPRIKKKKLLSYNESLVHNLGNLLQFVVQIQAVCFFLPHPPFKTVIPSLSQSESLIYEAGYWSSGQAQRSAKAIYHYVWPYSIYITNELVGLLEELASSGYSLNSVRTTVPVVPIQIILYYYFCHL